MLEIKKYFDDTAETIFDFVKKNFKDKVENETNKIVNK
jgi:hypothetical protein